MSIDDRTDVFILADIDEIAKNLSQSLATLLILKHDDFTDISKNMDLSHRRTRH